MPPFRRIALENGAFDEVEDLQKPAGRFFGIEIGCPRQVIRLGHVAALVFANDPEIGIAKGHADVCQARQLDEIGGAGAYAGIVTDHLIHGGRETHVSKASQLGPPLNAEAKPPHRRVAKEPFERQTRDR